MSVESVVLAAILLLGGMNAAAAGTVLDQVKAAGILRCGVITEPEDYTKDDTHGNLSVFGSEFCKAVAAAALGDGTKVKFSAFPDEQHGFEAIRAGQIDLIAGASPSAVKASIYAIQFGQPIFFDGQGLIVAKNSGIRSAADLANKQICFIANTNAEDELNQFFQKRNIAFMPFPFEEVGEMEAALVSGHCAAMTANISLLATARAAFHSRTKDFTVLMDQITLDPLSPVYRAGDAQWAAIIDGTLGVLIDAEINGVTGATVDAKTGSADLDIQALLGDRTGLARALGLTAGWSIRIIKKAGNYTEMVNRVFGSDTPLGSLRRLNAVWNKGGLHYAPQRR